MYKIKIPIYIYLILVILLSVVLFPSNSTKEQAVPKSVKKAQPISVNKIISNSYFNYEETKNFDAYINKFLNRWEIKGAGLAIMKNGKLIYSKGYGLADEEKNIKTDASNIFRVASLSKLITATAIMKLQEEGKLNISDKVFGEGGILDCEQFSKIKDKRVKNITIEHLLRHRGGFTLRRGDPLFTIREIMIWGDMDTVPDTDRLIEYCLTQRLGYTPGTSTSYSNLGYLILSKIIEVSSGMSYEDYCQKYILHPAKCYDMHLAKNLYKDKYQNEVRYYETWDAKPIPSFNNSSDSLYRSYGGNNIEGLFGAGGWVSSPIEFLRFISSVDGRDNIPDILNKESIIKMYSRTRGELPIGWVRASAHSDLLRTGSLAGTSAVAKCQRDGVYWVFITNTSSWKGSRFTKYIESMMRNALKKINLDNISSKYPDPLPKH